MIWRIASQDREYGKAKKGKNDEEKQDVPRLLCQREQNSKRQTWGGRRWHTKLKDSKKS